MKSRSINKKIPEAFVINEKPIPLQTWECGDGENLMEVIENDLRKCIRQCADLELTLTEEKRQYEVKTENLLIRIIEVLDSFEQLFQNIGDRQNSIDQQTKIWIGNFRTLYRLLKSIITEQGVVELELIDWSFDPHSQRVVETVNDSEKPDGTIVKQTLKGYLWNDRLLRKTEVVVVRNTNE